MPDLILIKGIYKTLSFVTSTPSPSTNELAFKTSPLAS